MALALHTPVLATTVLVSLFLSACSSPPTDLPTTSNGGAGGSNGIGGFEATGGSLGTGGASTTSSSSTSSSSGQPPPTCDPPNTIDVNGVCVPSCGVAGGNTCVDASSTLCEGLPALGAYDCAVCCNKPPDHSLVPNGFHILHKDFFTSWDSILTLVQAHAGPLLASQNKPDQIGFDKWAQVITSEYGVRDGATISFANGQDMAAFINSVLVRGINGPARVMIDELRSDTKDRIHECATTLRTKYPQWAGRWGTFVVHGNSVGYPNLNTDPTPTIDALLDASAIIVPEMYAKRSDYCAAGTTTAARDQWLEDFFRGSQGSFAQGRFHWLAQRRTSRNSSSQLAILFGVTDTYMTGTNPGVFLDRMFYVWRTRSGYPSTLLLGNGGPGAWKWHDQSPTSRDELYRESFEFYAVAGNTSSRLGQVTCP